VQGGGREGEGRNEGQRKGVMECGVDNASTPARTFATLHSIHCSPFTVVFSQLHHNMNTK
jgi:hypothetical protein